MPEFDETTGFVMDGSEFYGHGNQKRKNGMPYKDMNIGEKLKKKYGGTKQTTDKEGKKIYGDEGLTQEERSDWVEEDAFESSGGFNP